MADAEVREVRGLAVLAQEGRLRVQTPDGRSLLFVVDGDDAGVSLDGLAALAESGRMVRVRYRGEPEAGAVALAIRPD